MERAMKILSGISVLIFLSLTAIYLFRAHEVILTLCITFGTIAYHFLMRLSVGTIVNAIFHNKMDYTKRWFKPRRFEERLYRFLRVKSWKKHVPAFDPDTFSLNKHTLEEIVQATCQAEIVHEIIFLLSFAPVFLIFIFGEPAAFLITSFLAAAIDAVFVILQRYNRPRLVRLLHK